MGAPWRRPKAAFSSRWCCADGQLPLVGLVLLPTRKRGVAAGVGLPVGQSVAVVLGSASRIRQSLVFRGLTGFRFRGMVLGCFA